MPLLLPQNTKKYTLFLDLDETLIHTQTQFKKQINTKQEQLEYLAEIEAKLREEYKREPTKEEIDQAAIEHVFNIRPFCLEFLHQMS